MKIGAWGRTVLWFLAGVLIAGFGWVGLRQLHGSGPVVMRSYEVKPEIASKMVSALGAVLQGAQNAPPIGHVGLAPDHRHLLVSAPEAVQVGVADAIRQVAGYVPEETASSVTFDIWLVTAVPGASSRDTGLAEIAPALAQIEKTAGPARFRLLERSAAVTRSGEQGMLKGAVSMAYINSPLIRRTADGKRVVDADINVRISPSAGTSGSSDAVDARVELPPGQFLVIGQSSLAAADSARDTQLYYIVRASF